MKEVEQSSICQEPGCISWCELVYIDGVEWLKCRTCGAMRKSNKKKIKPLP